MTEKREGGRSEGRGGEVTRVYTKGERERAREKGEWEGEEEGKGASLFTYGACTQHELARAFLPVLYVASKKRRSRRRE